MSKVLIFSDVHIHPHKRSLDRLQHCLDALEWVFKTAEEQSVDHILFLGDLFHNRQRIEILTYHKAFNVFKKYLNGKIKLWLLLGNHDLWYRDKVDINSVAPFSALPGVTVVDCESTLDISGHLIDFIPFTLDPIESLNKLLKLRGDNPKKLLCAHIAIHGAKYNSGMMADVTVEHDGEVTKVDSSLFSAWDQVFLGHYHLPQIIQNVEYVGSPLQLSFGEADQIKHILIYDLETQEKEYIENNFSPKHLIIPYDQIKNYELKNNFIRIVVDDISSSDIVEIKDTLLNEVEVGSLEIKQNIKKEEDHTVENAKTILLDENSMFEEYIETVDIGELNREHLLAVGKKICSERGETELLQ